jgi:hypothetical protein
MIIEGNDFTYFVNGESKTKEEVNQFIDSNMSVSVDGLVVNFISPKKANLNVVRYYKQREKQSFEDLQNYLLNDTSEEKGLEDILNLITAENKEDLGQRFAEIKLKNADKEEKQSTYSKLEDTPISAKKDKIQELLEEVDKHQEQNGGRVVGVEFPFDMITREERETKVIEDWNKPRPKFEAIVKSGEQFKFNTTAENSNFGAKENKTEGIKEKNGKLHYELSWEFIEEMAKRMANNKSDKYPLYNWKKSIDVEDLKDAINRHHIEVMKGNYKDGEEVLGHIVSYACNSMMLWEQLNKK